MERPKLNDVEARVLGVLIEKAFTTPDQYPLSLNAIRNGCNQKSNRDPVTDFVEAEVVVGLQGLVPKHMAGKVSAAGSRVEKFRHTALQGLQVDAGELAVLAELLMRGAQTPGELRARVHRMVATATLPELHARLESLTAKGLVASVAPAPGSRAGRYAQLLAPVLNQGVTVANAEPAASVEPTRAGAPAPAPTAAVPTAAAPPVSAPTGTTGSALETRVAQLEHEVKELRELLEAFVDG